MEQKIVTNLWFDTEAEEAADFYCSIFKNSRIVSSAPYPEGTDNAGKTMVVEWELEGQRFVGINGGPQFKFDEAMSLAVMCETQEEIDYYWDALLEGGGEEGPCGWLKDRFGVSWQVTPKGMDAVYSDPDKSKAARSFEAMQKMKKLDIAALEEAAEGAPAKS